MATTVTVYCGVSADDGCTSDHDTAYQTDLNAAVIQVGSVKGGGSTATSGFRFPAVNVPQGTTITSATLTLTAQGSYHSGGTINVKVACQAADNPGVFTASPDKTFNDATRPRTTYSTGWDLHQVTDEVEYSKDITAQVQAVISRAGFVANNAIVTLLDDNGCTASEWNEFYSVDASATKCAKLVIVYTAAAATSIKKVAGVAQASVKVAGKVALASIKKMSGVSNVS